MAWGLEGNVLFRFGEEDQVEGGQTTSIDETHINDVMEVLQQGVGEDEWEMTKKISTSFLVQLSKLLPENNSIQEGDMWVDSGDHLCEQGEKIKADILLLECMKSPSAPAWLWMRVGNSLQDVSTVSMT